MSVRQQFIEAVLTRPSTFRALCAEFGISEKTGYKWRARFLAGGPAALADQSRAPHVAPHQPTAAVREAILELRWQQEFNTERPHEALGLTPPASHYVPSERPWPRRLPLLDYAAHLPLRRVRPNGGIRYQQRDIWLSTTLRREYVALTEQSDDRWCITFGPLQLGHWIASDDTFEPDLPWIDHP